MAQALVTGGCGFVGRHLVAELLARGDTVRVLDIAPPDGLQPAAEYQHGSTADPTAAEAALRGVDRLYNLAGIPHLWARRADDFDLANRRGAETMLAAAARTRIERVVHCSTESILLPKRRSGRAVDEADPPPLADMPGPYTRSKKEGEDAALAAARAGMNLVVVNPTVPIGAGDRNMTPPAAMLKLFLEGRSPFFLDCVLNLVDVRDLAHGIVLAADHGRAGERYILGGENVPLRELLPRLERLSGRPMPKRAVPPALALAAGLAGDWVSRFTGKPPAATREGVLVALRSAPFDSDKARRELGYRPSPIDQALAAAVAAVTPAA